MAADARIVNRGFALTLIALFLAGEAALRWTPAASPRVFRVVYGTTLSMYMTVAERLAAAAPGVRVLALGDSLALTQFQPDVFAGDNGWPEEAVFNASYLAVTFTSQERLLRHIGIERFDHLRQVLVFINPRRLTPEGNEDTDVFRVAIPDPDGPWPEMRRDQRLAPLLDYSRFYGLSRYLVGAAWRQVGRPESWDQVEFLLPAGGVSYEGQRLPGPAPGYSFQPIDRTSEAIVNELRRVIALFRSRGIEVVLLTNPHYPGVSPFAGPDVAASFARRMEQLASETGSVWRPIAPGSFRPPDDRDFLDYGHLNRAGGVAFTHLLSATLTPP